MGKAKSFRNTATMDIKFSACTGHRRLLTSIYLAVIPIILCFTFAVFCVYIRGVRAMSKKNTKPNIWRSLMNNSTIALYFLVTFATITPCLYIIDRCDSSVRELGSGMFFVAKYVCYSAQGIMIACSWLLRLHFSFQGTPYALRKRTIVGFVISFSMMCCLSISTISVRPLVPLEYERLWMFSGLLAWAWYVGTIVALVFLFVRKLLTVYRKLIEPENQEHKLIALVTKITILNIFSVLMTVVCLGTSRFMYANNVYLEFIYYWVWQMDCTSNFLCVALSYKHFERVYGMCCGAVHKMCHAMCFKWVTGVGPETMKHLSSASPPTTSETKTSQTCETADGAETAVTV